MNQQPNPNQQNEEANEYIELAPQNSALTIKTEESNLNESQNPKQIIDSQDEMISSLKAKLEVKALKTSLVSLSFLEGLFVSSNLVFFFIYTKQFKMSLPSYSLWDMFIFGIQIFNPVYGFIADSKIFFKGSKSRTLRALSLIGISLYALVALLEELNAELIFYFVLHFLIELIASFRCVIIDSFAAELNNMQKVHKQMINIKTAQKNLQFVKRTLPIRKNNSKMLISQNESAFQKTSSLVSFSDSRYKSFQKKLNKINSKTELPSSAIKVETFTLSESLKSKQLAHTSKSHTKSNANLNTSILFGTKLIGKIISNALVGLGYQYITTYFFFFFAVVYIILFLYLCFCVPSHSSINSTKSTRLAKFKSARMKSLKEIEELQNQTKIDLEGNSNKKDNIQIQQNVIDVHERANREEWENGKLWSQIKASLRLIKEKKLVRLLTANAFFKISPSFRSSFDFFLLHIMMFSSKEFSIQKILDSVCFFLGIILLNTLFRKFENKKFLIFNGITYSGLIFVLIFIVYIVFSIPEFDFFWLILIYSSCHSLFFELLFIPIAGLFLIINNI